MASAVPPGSPGGKSEVELEQRHGLFSTLSTYLNSFIVDPASASTSRSTGDHLNSTGDHLNSTADTRAPGSVLTSVEGEGLDLAPVLTPKPGEGLTSEASFSTPNRHSRFNMDESLLAEIDQKVESSRKVRLLKKLEVANK